MVFVKDFRKEFYDVIQHQRVLVLVAFDVDALCACKILQYLLQCDHVLYTIVPVNSIQDLERCCLDNSEGIQYIILINCGATVDLIETLQPASHVVFYVCDSHRPLEVHNIYNQVQVKLLMNESDVESIPTFTDIFRDDSSDDNNDESEDDSVESDGEAEHSRRKKKRRFNETALERRRERRLWEEKRKRILFEYSEFSSYSTSAALLMYELAWKLSKDTNDLLWLALTGVTEQYINGKVERDKYISSISQLQPHVSRHNYRPEESADTVSIDCLRITFDQELQLTLYRHWSLLESICHSVDTACQFRVWTLKGKKRLHEFLADMGLPLVQCKQKFVSMDLALKAGVKETMVKHAEKYGLSDQDLFLPSFHAQYGYKNKFCATDVLYACEAFLESMDTKSVTSDNFLSALDSLTRSQTKQLLEGIEMSKLQWKTIVAQVQTFLDMNQVICAGPFLYAFVQEGTPDARLFSKPISLQRLARFTLEAHCAVSKSKRAKSLPLVVGAHVDGERGSMLVVGVAPVSDKSCRNCFGKAFEQAAVSSNSRVLQDSFDSHYIELKVEDRSKFFDALICLLQ